MSKRNRVAPPQLEAGWEKSGEEAYKAEPGEEVVPAAAAEVEAAEPASGEALEAIGTQSDTTPPACMCQSVLGNLGHAEGYHARHIDLQLTACEQVLIARLRSGLVARHAQLANGKHIEKANDAVRWLIQQVAALSIATAGS